MPALVLALYLRLKWNRWFPHALHMILEIGDVTVSISEIIGFEMCCIVNVRSTNSDEILMCPFKCLLEFFFLIDVHNKTLFTRI